MLGNILTDYLIDLATKYIWYEGVCVCVWYVCMIGLLVSILFQN